MPPLLPPAAAAGPTCPFPARAAVWWLCLPPVSLGAGTEPCRAGLLGQGLWTTRHSLLGHRDRQEAFPQTYRISQEGPGGCKCPVLWESSVEEGPFGGAVPGSLLCSFPAAEPLRIHLENTCAGSKFRSTAWLPSLPCHAFLRDRPQPGGGPELPARPRHGRSCHPGWEPQAGIAPTWESTYSPWARAPERLVHPRTHPKVSPRAQCCRGVQTGSRHRSPSPAPLPAAAPLPQAAAPTTRPGGVRLPATAQTPPRGPRTPLPGPCATAAPVRAPPSRQEKAADRKSVV